MPQNFCFLVVKQLILRESGLTIKYCTEDIVKEVDLCLLKVLRIGKQR